ncbi:MAG: choice-of-anchor E domain-containing protein [Isosphaeraceae bacterium]
MPKRNECIGLLCMASLLLVGGSPARAEFTVTVKSAAIPTTQTDWGPTSSSLSGLNPLQLTQFDASKYAVGGQTAVLKSVDVKLDYQFDNRLALTFVNLSTITVTATGSINLFLPDGTTKLVPTATFANTGSLRVDPAGMLMKTVYLPNPPAFTSYTGSQTQTYTDAATLAMFTGKSTIGLPAVASATSKFTTDSGNGFGSSLTFASVVASLVYHYDLVPEPSSIVLTGLGVSGLLGFFRFRSRKASTKSAD